MGCFREGFEIRNWSSLSEEERNWAEEDAEDRKTAWLQAGHMTPRDQEGSDNSGR